MIIKIDLIPENLKPYEVVSAKHILNPSKPFMDLEEYLNLPNPTEEDLGKLKANTELLEVCQRMALTCLEKGGVGLSAPQVGINKRLFVIRNDDNTFSAYFNPIWAADSISPFTGDKEGCLSVPNINAVVKRYTSIYADYITFDEEMKPMRITRHMKDLRARVFQHECDHLDGYSILDRADIPRAQRRDFKKRIMKTLP